MVGAFLGKGLCNPGIHKVDNWTYPGRGYFGHCIQGGVSGRQDFKPSTPLCAPRISAHNMSMRLLSVRS